MARVEMASYPRAVGASPAQARQIQLRKRCIVVGTGSSPVRIGLKWQLNVGQRVYHPEESRIRPHVCLVSKTGRRTVGTGFGWNRERAREGAGMVAARSFDYDGGPFRPRITPRRTVQEKDGRPKNEDSRDDSIKGSVDLVSGKGSESQKPRDSASQLLQDQFNRFAAAVALGDRNMAEDVIREMGDADFSNASTWDFVDDDAYDLLSELGESAQILDDPVYQGSSATHYNRSLSEEVIGQVRNRMQAKIKQRAEEVTDLEKQLEELYGEVGRMIDEGEEETARELIEANYEALLEQLDEGIQGVEQAAMLDILAQLYMNMGDEENAEILLEKTKELLSDIPRSEPLLDRILDHVARMYAAIEKPDQAIPLYTRSLNMQKNIYGSDDPLLAATMLGLAKAYADDGQGIKSIELYEHLLVLMERTNGQDDESLVIPLTHLGHTFLEEGRIEEADNVLQRAVWVTDKAYGPEDGRVGVAMCALARAKTAQGQVDEAVQLYRKGLNLMEGCSRFASNDPVIEVVRTDLAEMLNYLNRDAEAQQLWEENLRVKQDLLGRNDIQLVPHLNNAATSYAHSEKFDKCEPLLRRSLKLMTIHYGPRAPEITVTLEMLATALHHLGRGFEAEPLAREAVSIRESHYGKDHPNTGQAYNCLAAILHGLDKTEEAETLLWRVFRIQERELGPDCPELILTLELLIMLLDEQGRTAELQPLLRRMQKLEALLEAAAS